MGFNVFFCPSIDLDARLKTSIINTNVNVYTEFQGDCVVPQGLVSHDITITIVVRTLLAISIEILGGGLEHISEHCVRGVNNV